MRASEMIMWSAPPKQIKVVDGYKLRLLMSILRKRLCEEIIDFYEKYGYMAEVSIIDGYVLANCLADYWDDIYREFMSKMNYVPLSYSLESLGREEENNEQGK